MISLKNFRTPLSIGLTLVGMTILIPACTNLKVVQVGSHKVTVSRHGFEKKLVVAKDAAVPSLEYAGIAADGRGLKVAIEGDKVTVNGVSGQLRAGDSVLISDDGVAVNSMDYGESAKYLQANNSAANVSGLN
jgi:hypothetical protein